jgi:hypothetical protein
VTKNVKVLLVALAVFLIALLIIISGNTMLGLAVFVLGAIGIVALYQRLSEAEDDAPPVAKKAKKGRSKLEEAIDASGGEAVDTAAPPRRGGLPAWNPTALDTWSPPSLSDPDGATEEAAPESSWDTWDNDWADEPDGDTVTDLSSDDDNPLADLDRLDDIDPIAEVERIDAIRLDERADDIVVEDEPIIEEQAAPSKGGFSFSAAPPVIHEEEIKTADDIMAASQATELTVPDESAGDGDSELAKLLAKVQARLAAYE